MYNLPSGRNIDLTIIAYHIMQRNEAPLAFSRKYDTNVLQSVLH